MMFLVCCVLVGLKWIFSLFDIVMMLWLLVGVSWKLVLWFGLIFRWIVMFCVLVVFWWIILVVLLVMVIFGGVWFGGVVLNKVCSLLLVYIW